MTFVHPVFPDSPLRKMTWDMPSFSPARKFRSLRSIWAFLAADPPAGSRYGRRDSRYRYSARAFVPWVGASMDIGAENSRYRLSSVLIAPPDPNAFIPRVP